MKLHQVADQLQAIKPRVPRRLSLCPAWSPKVLQAHEAIAQECNGRKPGQGGFPSPPPRAGQVGTPTQRVARERQNNLAAPRPGKDHEIQGTR